MYNILYVGIDDTDSKNGMCTTYICAVVLDKLKACGYKAKGMPRLIRLNPFAPHKTRGNGAVSFKLSLQNKKQLSRVKKLILECVEQLSEVEDPKTNPGVVFLSGEIDQRLQNYALKTVRQIVTQEEAELLARDIGAELYKYKNGRGIIGALAAMGCPLEDKTYELIAYRSPENYGTPRKVDANSVRVMNKKTFPKTFDNVDNDYVIITPHTPCPVLYGIRGETPEIVEEAHQLVKTEEPLEQVRTFLTNQHTDQHIQIAPNIQSLKKCQCYAVKGNVKDYPHVILGGHVIFTLEDSTGEIECAAYEPTKSFRNIIRQLIPGDKLLIYGGIGRKGTLNLEKIEILELEDTFKILNPVCKCGKRMKSAGKGKGYKCPSCGAKTRENSKEKQLIERNLKPGWYESPASARRHLSKPIIRFKNFK